jgi:hypothetical protein
MLHEEDVKEESAFFRHFRLPEKRQKAGEKSRGETPYRAADRLRAPEQWSGYLLETGTGTQAICDP